MTQMHSLGSSPRGRRALRHLLAAPSSGTEDDPELLLDATRAGAVDAFAGAVLFADIEHHLGRWTKSEVVVRPPESGSILGRFCDLLTLIPNRCTLALPTDKTTPVRDPRVLMPAVRIGSVNEANALALFLKAGSQAGRLGTARLTPKEAGFLAAALPTLAENSIVHAPDSTCGTVACSALEAENREVQLVVMDLGTAVSDNADPLAALRNAWARSRTEPEGGLFLTVELARQLGLDISLQLITGSAFARWRGRWHSDAADFIPGWTAAVTIHR